MFHATAGQGVRTNLEQHDIRLTLT